MKRCGRCKVNKARADKQSYCVPIASVKAWDKNARKIKPDDAARLKRQIQKHGIFKPLLVFRESDGYVTLGGNMRLQAMRELGHLDVLVTVIEPDSEQEKLEISLADNDRAGYYDESALLANFADFPAFPYDDYKVDFSEPMLLRFDYKPIENDVRLDEKTKVKCPECGHEF